MRHNLSFVKSIPVSADILRFRFSLLLSISYSFSITFFYSSHFRYLVLSISYYRLLPIMHRSSATAILFTMNSPQRKNNTLLDLPPELLFQIAAFLSDITLKSLSLCNKRLHQLLKKHERLHSFTKFQSLLMLVRLERDLPQFFSCYICQKLHKYDLSESFGLSGIARRKSSRLPCDYKGDNWKDEYRMGHGITQTFRSHSDFNHSRNRLVFHQVKLAIRRFQYGTDYGISTDSLSYTQVRYYSHPLQVQSYSIRTIHPDIPTLYSIQAQICREPLGLLIRMQDILLFETWEDSKLLPDKNPMRFYEICKHVSLTSKMSDLGNLRNGKESQFIYNCPRCNTHCVLEILNQPNSTIALIMTRWVNLGSGLDEEDPLWKVHVFHSYESARVDPLPRRLMVYSPRLGFEIQSIESFEQLKSRNLYFLREDRYKKGEPFVKECRRLWHISYKEPPKNGGAISWWSWLCG